MSRSPARVAAVSAALLLAGGIFGGIAGASGLVIIAAIGGGWSPEDGLLLLAAASMVGAVLGALLLPLTSWLLLRRVPLGLSWFGTTVGAVLGGCLHWFALDVIGSEESQYAILGAMIGFFVAVIVLRMRFSAPREGVRVSASTGA